MTLRRSSLSLLPALALLACGAEFHAAEGSADGSGGMSMVNLAAPGVLPTVPPSPPLTPDLGLGSGVSSSTGGAAASGAGGANSMAASGAKNASGAAANASGGSAAAACASGKVTLRLMPPLAAPAGAYCQSSCSMGWLEITTSAGASVVTGLPCGAVTCDQCKKMACPAAQCVNTSLSEKGVTFDWDGTQYLANACSTGNLCQEKSCVARGRFFAKMCMPLTETQNGVECVASEKIVCTAPIGFDFPGPSVVSGTLPLP